MRTVLKVLAGILWWPILATLLLVWRLWRADSLKTVVESGLFGAATALGWALTLVMGPVAAILLWRLEERGRRVALCLSLFALGYYLISWAYFRSPQTNYLNLAFAVAGNFAFAAILLAKPAREACQKS